MNKELKLKPNELALLNENYSTYETVPGFILKKPKDKVIFIKKELIKKWFEANQGRKRALPLNQIAGNLGFEKYGNSVEFRFLVASLVVDDLYPVISCSEGYYKASCLSDITNNIHTEECRVKGIQRRIDALEKIRAWAGKIGMK